MYLNILDTWQKDILGISILHVFQKNIAKKYSQDNIIEILYTYQNKIFHKYSLYMSSVKYRKYIFMKYFTHIVFLYLYDFYDNMVKKYF